MSQLQPQEREPEIAPKPAPTFAIASQPSYLRTLFLGPDGLRPGWGIAFYFITYYFLRRILVEWVTLFDFGASGLWSMLLAEMASVVAAVIPAVVLRRIERRPWRSYGLPLRNAFGGQFWMGALWGFSAVSLLMFSLYELHIFSFGHVVLHAVRAARFAAFWAAMFLSVGLFEEFVSRGYSLFTMARAVQFWPAAVILSCGFGLFHLGNEGEHWPGLLAAALIGLFFCLTLRRTGNLWFAVGFHAAWDWGETFFYSVPDSGLVSPGHLLSSSLHGSPWLSGGTVGPEGSLLCFVVIAIVWVAFERSHPAAQSVFPHAILTDQNVAPTQRL